MKQTNTWLNLPGKGKLLTLHNNIKVWQREKSHHLSLFLWQNKCLFWHFYLVITLCMNVWLLFIYNTYLLSSFLSCPAFLHEAFHPFSLSSICLSPAHLNAGFCLGNFGISWQNWFHDFVDPFHPLVDYW